MTRKDYELIAKAIKDVGLFYHVSRLGQPTPETVLWSVAVELAREFGDDNVRFEKQRFLESCEVDTYTTENV